MVHDFGGFFPRTRQFTIRSARLINYFGSRLLLPRWTFLRVATMTSECRSGPVRISILRMSPCKFIKSQSFFFLPQILLTLRKNRLASFCALIWKKCTFIFAQADEHICIYIFFTRLITVISVRLYHGITHTHYFIVLKYLYTKWNC